MPISNVGVGLQKALVLTANHFVRKMEERIRQNNLPDAISRATSIGTPVQTGQATYIDVTIDTSKDGPAPMAAAFEYGSGIWSERGIRQKYRIEPDQASVLAFPWGEAQTLNPSVIGRGNVEIKGGKAFLPGVSHPGVRARPYIRPTLQAERAEFRRILAREFVNLVRLGGVTEIIE